MNVILRLVIVILLELATLGYSAKIIVNEYNAVGSEKYLETEDEYGSTKADLRFGRIKGNGDNWIELVVTEDHADLRNYQIRWWEYDYSIQDNPDAIWATNADKVGSNQGIITFKNVDFWSDVRSGTIITLTEKETLTAQDAAVVVSGSKIDTNLVPGSDGDWWINIWTADPDEPYVHTETLEYGGSDGNFSVGNDDWEVNIYDGTQIVFGPIGEAYDGFGSGINSKEIAKLQADPSSDVTVDDFSDGTSSTFGLPNVWHDGVTGEEFTQNFNKLRKWSWIPGDANLDNKVNVTDLSLLAANYNTTAKATWAMGDFDNDGKVNVTDLSLLAANYNRNVNGTSITWADAYAQAFGTTSDASEDSADEANDETSNESVDSTCSSLGLSLIAAMGMAGLMFTKLKD
jgi:hypothetical protein